MTRRSAVYYNIRSLGRRWHLSDIPEEWLGFQLLASADWNKDRQITADEILDVDWLSFVQAIRDFQSEHNLTTDGKLGPMTLSTLQEVYHTPADRPLLTLGELSLHRPAMPTSEPKQPIDFALTRQEQSIANLWNQYGRIIAQQADAYQIPLTTALAVFKVESGRAYHPETGLTIIRFEPHIFLRKSGHQVNIRRGGQRAEWNALQNAYAINPNAALESTSYGLPQIMGFNAKRIGYDSAQALLQDFQNSCEAQVKGFFKFLEANDLLKAVRAQDWQHFTRRYNGPGNVPVYQGRLTQSLDTIEYMIEDGAELIA